jgi:RNA polymerase sigma factor (sigma-70 family)
VKGKLLPLRRARAATGEPAEDGAGPGDRAQERMSDEALVAACSVGDAAALGALYDRLQPQVWRFLARLTGRHTVDDLDDLVQATFLAVGSAAARYRGGAAVRTWVFAIAANVARRHAEGRSQHQRAIDRFAELPADPAARPDETTLRRDLLRRVREALDSLPHDLRVAFVMCEVEEVAGREAARVLDIPEGTLWRRLHDARRAVRAAVDGEDAP